MIGPRVAMTKRSRANCTAVNNWPRMKNTWAGRTMRVRRVASAIWASLKPGSTVRSTGEMKGSATASRSTEPINSTRVIDQNARQASSSSPAAKRRVRIGIRVMAM